MTLAEIMTQLEAMGSEQTKKTFTRHGAPEPVFGVKVGDLKTIVKLVKQNQDLALALYETGNSDAMYLAGLIANPKAMSAETLQSWAEKAPWYMIAEYTVAWVAAESPHGWDLGLKWIKNETEAMATIGWATLASWIALQSDDTLDMDALTVLLHHIQTHIHTAPNRVRYTMNGFVIAVGSYVLPLSDLAEAVAKAVGLVQVDMGGTACKVPSAVEVLQKVRSHGRLGKKRKTVRC